ncbi:MAG: FAD-dependent oxidoreductase [Parcubacteria group bacterium]|nr:FAD-dependent oxidoreductase [Parcubacteria group bacterium]
MKTKETSTWIETASLPTFPKLTKNLTTDVAVIGGGLAGLLSAYVLAKEGKKVVVIEKDRFAAKATGYTTGFLSQLIDTDTADLIEMFGEADTKKIWNSHGDAIDLIEKIVKSEKIDCEFVRCKNYVYANDSRERKELDSEFSEMKKLKFEVSMKAVELGFKNRGVMTINKQGKYHDRKFIAGLLPALQKMGVELYEQTEVTDIVGNSPFTVKAGKHEVTADWTITATYQPFNNPSEVFLKKGMYKSYILELEVPKGKYPEGTYEDMDNPYHYFRVDAGKGAKGKDRLIIGGEDHRAEIPMNKKNFDVLEDYAEDLFGKRYPVVRNWSGFILESVDGLPFIGQYKPGNLLATAFSGNGMTYSAISAMIFRDIIAHKKNPYTALYSPERSQTFTQLWKKGRDFGEEFLKGALANVFK